MTARILTLALALSAFGALSRVAAADDGDPHIILAPCDPVPCHPCPAQPASASSASYQAVITVKR